MTQLFRQFLADQSGATSIEYALIAAGIALAIITKISGRFSAISTSLK